MMLKLFFMIFALLAGQDAVNCRWCKDQGYAPCKKHKKNVLETEEHAIRCSELIQCKACGGTLKIPCTRCKLDLSKEIAAEREAMKTWLEKMQEIEEYVGKVEDCMHCESKHFILTYNLSRITVEKRAVSPHQGMHLYLKRLEALYDDVCKDLGAKDEDFLAKTQVMIWRREREVTRSAAKYCNQSSNTKSYLLGRAPIFTIYYNKAFLHEEYELHQAVVHNVVHCLLSNVWDGIWPGNIRGAWLDSGYAHHYELKYFKQYGGAVRNYCYSEVDDTGFFKFGKWRSSVRRAVEAGEEPSFIETASKNLVALKPRGHMFAWSYVDFILSEYPDKFGDVAKLVKQKKPISDVTREGLGMTPFKFEEKWREFVKTDYPMKDEKTLPPRWKRR